MSELREGLFRQTAARRNAEHLDSRFAPVISSSTAAGRAASFVDSSRFVTHSNLDINRDIHDSHDSTNQPSYGTVRYSTLLTGYGSGTDAVLLARACFSCASRACCLGQTGWALTYTANA